MLSRVYQSGVAAVTGVLARELVRGRRVALLIPPHAHLSDWAYVRSGRIR